MEIENQIKHGLLSSFKKGHKDFLKILEKTICPKYDNEIYSTGEIKQIKILHQKSIEKVLDGFFEEVFKIMPSQNQVNLLWKSLEIIKINDKKFFNIKLSHKSITQFYNLYFYPKAKDKYINEDNLEDAAYLMQKIKCEDVKNLSQFMLEVYFPPKENQKGSFNFKIQKQLLENHKYTTLCEFLKNEKCLKSFGYQNKIHFFKEEDIFKIEKEEKQAFCKFIEIINASHTKSVDVYKWFNNRTYCGDDPKKHKINETLNQDLKTYLKSYFKMGTLFQGNDYHFTPTEMLDPQEGITFLDDEMIEIIVKNPNILNKSPDLKIMGVFTCVCMSFDKEDLEKFIDCFEKNYGLNKTLKYLKLSCIEMQNQKMHPYQKQKDKCKERLPFIQSILLHKKIVDTDKITKKIKIL